MVPGNNSTAPGVYPIYPATIVDPCETPKRGLCMTYNGNKVKTFDGLVYSSSLHCSNTLYHDKLGGLFSVILKNCPKDLPSCKKSIIVQLSNIKYTFKRDNKDILFDVEGVQHPIPFSATGINVKLQSGVLKIDLDQAQTTVSWHSKSSITVEVSPLLRNRTAGLCGTFDDDHTNDFESRDGTIHQSPKNFVDSWKAFIHDTDENRCRMLDEPDWDEQKCPPKIMNLAKETCGKLLNNMKLQGCTKKFNFEMVMRSCLSDYCFCHNKREPQICSCKGISMLAKVCEATHEVNFGAEGWRDTTICRKYTRAVKISKS